MIDVSSKKPSGTAMPSFMLQNIIGSQRRAGPGRSRGRRRALTPEYDLVNACYRKSRSSGKSKKHKKHKRFKHCSPMPRHTHHSESRHAPGTSRLQSLSPIPEPILTLIPIRPVFPGPAATPQQIKEFKKALDRIFSTQPDPSGGP